MLQKKFTIIFVCLLLTIVPKMTNGCPVCYGNAEGPMIQGMNMAIFVLLGITGSILSGFVAFFLYLKKRIQMFESKQFDENQ